MPISGMHLTKKICLWLKEEKKFLSGDIWPTLLRSSIAVLWLNALLQKKNGRRTNLEKSPLFCEKHWGFSLFIAISLPGFKSLSMDESVPGRSYNSLEGAFIWMSKIVLLDKVLIAHLPSVRKRCSLKTTLPVLEHPLSSLIYSAAQWSLHQVTCIHCAQGWVE